MTDQPYSPLQAPQTGPTSVPPQVPQFPPPGPGPIPGGSFPAQPLWQPGPPPLPKNGYGAPGRYEFHRLGRASTQARWYHPLLSGLVSALFYLLASFIVGALFASVLLATVADGQRFVFDLEDLSQYGADPRLLLFLFGSVALMLPCFFAGQWLLGYKLKFGHLSSVAGGLRWNLFVRYQLYAAGFFLLTIFLGLLVDLVAAPVESPFGTLTGANFAGWNLLLAVLLLFLVLPLQCAAEEYVFRGFLMQTVGQWVRHPAVAIAIQIPLFMVAHGYGLWGQISVGLMALTAGWLTYRTGGLEAAIALHIANNFFAVFLAMLFDEKMDPNATGDVLMVLLEIPFLVGFVWAVERHYRSSGLPNYLEILPRPELPQPGPQPGQTPWPDYPGSLPSPAYGFTPTPQFGNQSAPYQAPHPPVSRPLPVRTPWDIPQPPQRPTVRTPWDVSN